MNWILTDVIPARQYLIFGKNDSLFPDADSQI